MKLLHTGDWHLNHVQGRVDRAEHLRRRVEKVAEICERESVDVLLHAGDWFSEHSQVNARVNQVAESFTHMRKVFAPFFARGGILLGVTGNHDQDGRIRPHIDLARAGMNIVSPSRRPGDRFTPGNFYLVDTFFHGRVRDEKEGFDAQFVLLPFPSLGRVLAGSETANSPSELNRSVGEAVAGRLRGLPDESGYDKSLHTILVAHIHATGADVNRGLLRLDERSDVVLESSALNTGFAYIALGHVHKPQCLRGLEHVRYCGSLDRTDHGDHDEMKYVVLVDIGPKGRRSVTPIEIPPTPLVTVVIHNAATVQETIAAQVPDASAAVVRIEFAAEAAAAGAAVDAAVHAALPDAVSTIIRPTMTLNPAAAQPLPEGSIRTRVLGYLAERIPVDDPQRADLLALADTFLTSEGHP
jgi:exonuclease SbcD